MKSAILVLPILAVVLTGCNPMKMINESTNAINRNRHAVDMSTCAIQRNIETVERSNQVIEENIRKLKEINESLDSAK